MRTVFSLQVAIDYRQQISPHNGHCGRRTLPVYETGTTSPIHWLIVSDWLGVGLGLGLEFVLLVTYTVNLSDSEHRLLGKAASLSAKLPRPSGTGLTTKSWLSSCHKVVPGAKTKNI